MEEYIILSLRKNPQILGLFSKGQKYQPLVNRVDFLDQGIDYALSSNSDWKKISGVNVDYSNIDIATPEFFQLRVDKKKWGEVVEQIKNSFRPPLQRTTGPYVVKLILINYIQYLASIQRDKEETASDSAGEFEIKELDLTRPEMAKILCEMMLTDYGCDELKAICQILLDWRNNTYGNDA